MITESGIRVCESEGYPEAFRAGAMAHVRALEALYGDDGSVVWSVLSPSAQLVGGPKSGAIELGLDTLLSPWLGSR